MSDYKSQTQSNLTEPAFGGSDIMLTTKEHTDHQDYEPLYAQVSSYIRDKIYSKEWGPNRRIPSEHCLMEKFGVSRGTVRKAISILVDDGLLEQEHGRGTFVRENELSHPGGDRPLSFAASLSAQGLSFTTSVMLHEIIPAQDEVGKFLQLGDDDFVLHLKRVRSVSDEPIMMLESWLSIPACPGIENVDMTKTSAYEAVEEKSKRRIAYSQMTYSARAAGKECGQYLQVSESAPVLNLEQLIYLEDNTPIEWSTVSLRAGQTICGTGIQHEYHK